MKKILFFKSILGKCIFDLNTNSVFMFGTENNILKTDFTKMDSISNEYKTINVINKPFCVLAYQQATKGQKYGLTPIILSQEQLNDILSKDNFENL